jgi:hypothetical protein
MNQIHDPHEPDEGVADTSIQMIFTKYLADVKHVNRPNFTECFPSARMFEVLSLLVTSFRSTFFCDILGRLKNDSFGLVSSQSFCALMSSAANRCSNNEQETGFMSLL